jgi:thiamine biosynthesis lipoprotein
VEGVLSATVVAPTAAMADALSTAFYVMGPDLALDYCKRYPDVGAVLVSPGPHGGTVEIHTAGLGKDVLVMFDPQQS